MKRTLKRSLSVLLAIAIIFSSAYAGLGEVDFSRLNFNKLFAVKANAASTSDLTFSLNVDGDAYCVTNCNTSATGSITIPSTYSGKPVTSIGNSAFYNCTSLTSITIPTSVTSIVSAAFSSCTSLTSITIPTSVTSIGDNAFRRCTALTSVTIPKSVTNMGICVFGDCTALKTVYWNAKEVEYKTDVHKIFGNAGTSGSGIEMIFGDTVEVIPSNLCYIPESDANFYSPKITSVKVGKNVKTVAYGAFRNCKELTNITIPDSVTTVVSSAFLDTGYYNNESNWVNNVLYIGNHLIEAKDDLTGAYSIKSGTKTISGNAFNNCTNLTSITIPYGIKSINNSTFSGCLSLVSVTLPNSVTSIGYGAFCNCTSLTSITIPNSVTSIGESAFIYCTNLTSITIPDSVTSIIRGAFASCTSLTSVTIPASVTDMEGAVFSECTHLETVNWNAKNATVADGIFFNAGVEGNGIQFVFGDTVEVIPANLCGVSSLSYSPKVISVTVGGNVKSIGNGAFYYCDELTNINIPDSVKGIGANVFFGTAYYNNQNNWINGVLYIGNHLIEGKNSLSGAYSIKSGTKSIADSALSSTRFSSVTIPNSVEFIGSGFNWYGLTAINVESDNSNYSSFNGILFNKAKTVLIKYPVSKTDSSYKIPSGITSIGNSAFEDCSSLTSITISDGVTSIGNSAFEDCTSLTSITIPNSVTSIGNSAFCNCTSLTSITIPGSVTSIGNSAFRNCTNLTSITIPDSVTSIGDFAFNYCTKLTSITIPDSVTSIGEAVFYRCYSLNTIIIPGSVNTIPKEAFGECRNLSSVTIKKGVKNIGEKAFYNCEGLTSIIIADSVTSIGSSAFGYCKSLASISIPNSVTSMGSSVFFYCSSLTSVAIPEGVPSLPGSFFKYCSSLVSITIPVSVKSVGSTATDYCSVLKYVFYTGTENQWKGITFEGDGYSILRSSAYKHYNATDHTYSTEFTVDTKPTCTKDGSKSYHCTVCNLKKDVTSIPALGHNYSAEWTVDVDPTCTKDGSKSRHCSNCSSKLDIISIPALGHDFSTEWTVDVEPTCTDDGSKSHHCNVCGDKTDITIINSFGGHYFENNICIKCNADLEMIICTILKSGVLESAHNYSSNANETKTFTASGADYIEVVFSSATEVENSYDKIYIYNGSGLLIGTYTGTTLANKTIRVEGDTVKIKLTSDSSVTKYGYYATCTAYRQGLHCNNHLNKKIVNIVETDCINDGYSGDILCAVCETVVEQGEVVPALGHSCDEWIIDAEPNCTETGSKHGTCTVCGETATEVIPVFHSSTMWVTEQEPNCTEAGYKDEWCLDCGELINTEEIPATGHVNTMWVTEQEPTCDVAGYKDEYCLDCGEVVSTETIPETGHSYGDWIIDVEPTCTEDGSKHQICSVCGDVNTEIILSEGHSFSTEWTIDVAPTCTEAGSKSHHCTACEEITDVTVVEALGHTYSTEWTVDIKPTCTVEGSKSHHCIVCNNAKGDVTVVEPMGHNFSVISVANEHPHIILSECSRCPETKEEESYSEKCGVCNFTYTENADGTCKITAYTGSSDTLIIPATINGKTVATTNTGAFKNNTTLTSVKIENGVQGIGTLAFLGCKSLSKVVIPESVTSIGANAFYNCSNDLTIYCYSGSYAMQYAIDNSLNYEIINIGETDNCTIDYDNKIIFANDTFTTGLDEIADLSSNTEVSVQGSFVSGSVEIFGTGSKVTITDGDSSFEYTLVINGDLNGDGTCDVIDASIAYLYSVDMEEASEIEIIAANGCVSDELDANSYQNVVNMCLA